MQVGNPHTNHQTLSTKITTLDQAREWTLRLHDFGVVYKDFLNEKTPVPKERRTLSHQWEWTHLRVRKAYNSLLHLSRHNWLFTYLQPPPEALEPVSYTHLRAHETTE